MKFQAIFLILFGCFCEFSARAPCGGDLTQPQGEFFSPHYPHLYPSNAHCTWNLTSFDWQTISLTFTFVDLESCCDFVRVYDGTTDQAPLLGQVPGNQGNSFNSSSRNMIVVFSSDYGWSQQGFRAEWAFIGGAPCGGNLNEPQGEFFSPNFPNNYPDNANCTWRLQSSNGQVVSLSFKSVQLETGWDLVHVYNGLSDQDPKLGVVTGNQGNSFTSSGNYMTVVFCSDSWSTLQGFRAEWHFIKSDTARKGAIETTPETHLTKPSQTEADKQTLKIFSSVTLKTTTKASLEATPATEPVLPPQTSPGQVDCVSGRMNIAISKSYIDSLGHSWSDLFLGDSSCKASINNHDIIFNVPLNSCDTWRKIHKGYIIYTNYIKMTKLSLESIRTLFLLEVSCVFRHNAIVEAFYETKENEKPTISEKGRFNPTIVFYNSSSFSNPITEFPYLVNFSQELFVQVQLSEADPSLHLFIDSCVASPNQNFTAETHDLIRNGCPRVNRLHIYTNGVTHYARFRFLALMFLRTHKRIFLKCDVVICANDDYNSRCHRGCLPRKKRSLSSTHHAEVVTLGPILLKGPEEAAAKNEE
ncbi:hypothetical protein AMELA_G00129310 [Ameiurus melas]|uniref:CUB and zona pellucida-like domain-containing protein 1 n=1 Tax=Ameiurus melas TaxID=219545 RepID=A0A7J6AQV3_AMEME|nr:hypothetical protein AMELA_G00129310 [Ameiurus melas]